MKPSLEHRLLRLEARRPRSREVILRKARIAAQRIELLPPEQRERAWHEFYLDYSSAELQIIIDGE